MRLSNKLRKLLTYRCVMTSDAIDKLGQTVTTKTGQLTHIDNGSNVLAVVHRDWVVWQPPRWSRDGTHIYCGQLDDRLGLWVILDLLPAMGVTCDVLITDNEETGNSTAEWYRGGKNYNWMFQFDRRGSDSVLYDYDSPSNRKLFKAHGLDIGIGSFSDICKLDTLGITGINVATGYHHEHSTDCYADLRVTVKQAAHLASFWRQNKDILIPAPAKPPKPDYSQYSWSRASDYPTSPINYYDRDWYESIPSEDYTCVCGDVFSSYVETHCPSCARLVDV